MKVGKIIPENIVCFLRAYELLKIIKANYKFCTLKSRNYHIRKFDKNRL